MPDPDSQPTQAQSEQPTEGVTEAQLPETGTQPLAADPQPAGAEAAIGTPDAVPPAAPEVEPHPSRPATIDELHALRRWLWVAGAWAAAASVIAVIAVLDNEEPQRPAAPPGLTTRITNLERTLTARVVGLEQRIGAAAAVEDVTKLERRLRRAERDLAEVRETAEAADKTSETVTELDDRLDELDERVETLELEPASGKKKR